MYPEIYNVSKYDQPGRWRKNSSGDVFTCHYCQAHVCTQPLLSGVNNRNHCPYCLWSRHVDLLRAGDRMSACKAMMEPIGLTIKQRQKKYGNGRGGELMLIHRCSDCGKLSINRIAADDLTERLMDIFYSSFGLDVFIQAQLNASGIRLLMGADHELVTTQLHGMTQH
jgi:RNHCP domain